MMTPHPTEQYGQVLRVSLVRSSLKARTAACAAAGEKPNAVKVEAPIDAPVSLSKPRRETLTAPMLLPPRFRRLRNAQAGFRKPRLPVLASLPDGAFISGAYQ
jgi:hypothetical protein